MIEIVIISAHVRDDKAAGEYLAKEYQLRRVGHFFQRVSRRARAFFSRIRWKAFDSDADCAQTSKAAKPAFDPYVRIRLSGAKGDHRKFKTPCLSEREASLGPGLWKSVFFVPVTWSDFAFLEFSIKSRGGRLRVLKGRERHIGSATVWANAIRDGYRAIPIRANDERGVLVGELFCHFKTRSAE